GSEVLLADPQRVLERRDRIVTTASTGEARRALEREIALRAELLREEPRLRLGQLHPVPRLVEALLHAQVVGELDHAAQRHLAESVGLREIPTLAHVAFRVVELEQRRLRPRE